MLIFYDDFRNVEEKCKLYEEYIDIVKELSLDKAYAECDSDGILKVFRIHFF
jgi:hypothetical protein